MSNENIWIALISAGSGILTALGINKVIPSILEWFKDWRENKRTLRKEEAKKLQDLLDRVDLLEKQVDVYRNFQTRTDTAFKTLLPVIHEIMKDHPSHIALFDQLKNIIFNDADPKDL